MHYNGHLVQTIDHANKDTEMYSHAFINFETLKVSFMDKFTKSIKDILMTL